MVGDASAAEHEAVIAIVSGAVPRDFVLRVVFDDGCLREIDLDGELRGEMFEPLQDPAVFRLAAVDHELGTVVWPNGADLDPDVLYGLESSADAAGHW